MWLLAAWTFVLGCTPMRSMDIWWHLRTGEWIVSECRVPQTDLYTFTVWDRPWIDLHWGFQLLAWGLYSLGSTPLLVLTKAVCLTVTVLVAMEAARIAGRAGRQDCSSTETGVHSAGTLPNWLEVLCWLPAVVCLSGRSIVRPEMLSILFLAVFLRLCAGLERRPKQIFWFPLLILIWVNCHALFVLGGVILAAWLADFVLRKWAGGRYGCVPLATDEPRIVFYGMLSSVLVCFANPYFEEGVFFPLVLFQKFSTEHAFYSQRIGEFVPPLVFFHRHSFTNLYLNMEMLLFVATMASVVALACQRQTRPFRWLLFVAFAYLGWKASRNTAPFALVSGWVLVANVTELYRLFTAPVTPRNSGKVAPRSKRPANPRKVSERTTLRSVGSTSAAELRSISSWAMAGLLCLLIGSVFTGHWGRWTGENRGFGVGEADGWYAHGAARFAGQDGMPLRAYVSHIGQAAVYIFHNGPERRVFMDGRLEVATQQTFVEFETIGTLMSAGDRRWMDLVRDAEGNLPAVLLDSRSARAEIRGLAIQPDWRMVYAEPAGALFIPTALADRLELPPADFRPLVEPPGTRVLRTPQ